MASILARHYKLLNWATLFLLTVVAGIFLVRHYVGGFGEFLKLFKEITPSRWLLLLLLTSLFYLLDYVRAFTLFSILGHKLSLSRGLQLTTVSYFISSLTPTSELNLPAMAYLMKKDGVPASSAVAVIITKTFYTVLWICIFAVFMLQLKSGVHLPRWFSQSVFIGRCLWMD